MRSPALFCLLLEAVTAGGCAATPRPASDDRGGAATSTQGREDGTHRHRHATARHRFEDAQHWARVFEDPERDAWQKPAEVIAALRIPREGRVADIGAASGYFSVRIARAHPDADVYGVDIEPNLVEYLRARAEREKLSNLLAVQGEASDPKLPEPVDVILLVNTYHHIEQRPTYFNSVAAKLRPGGRVAVVDFRKGSKIGPPDHHKLPEETVISEMAEARYRLAERYDFLPHQYMLVFTPAR